MAGASSRRVETNSNVSGRSEVCLQVDVSAFVEAAWHRQKPLSRYVLKKLSRALESTLSRRFAVPRWSATRRHLFAYSRSIVERANWPDSEPSEPSGISTSPFFSFLRL